MATQSEAFQKAVADSKKLTAKPTNDELLELYGTYSPRHTWRPLLLCIGDLFSGQRLTAAPNSALQGRHRRGHRLGPGPGHVRSQGEEYHVITATTQAQISSAKPPTLSHSTTRQPTLQATPRLLQELICLVKSRARPRRRHGRPRSTPASRLRRPRSATSSS